MGSHFGWPKITFYRISRISDQYTNFCSWNLFSKFPLAILYYRRSLSITFVDISGTICNFNVFGNYSQNVHRRPFWLNENHFRLHFLPFQINTQLYFFGILSAKCPQASILDDRKSLQINTQQNHYDNDNEFVSNLQRI